MPRIPYTRHSPEGRVEAGRFHPTKSYARRATDGSRDILYQTTQAWVLYTYSEDTHEQLTIPEAKRWLTGNGYDLRRVLFTGVKDGKMSISLGIKLKTKLYNMAADQGTTPNAVLRDMLAAHIDNAEKET